MKKLFTLTMLALLAFATGADAQNYRKWDFTSWSATTIANLTAEAAAGVTGGNWSDTEKANGDNPQVGNCYWSYADNVDADGNLTANGVVIAETEGLVFNTGYTSRRSLAIAVNYASTSLGDYGGAQYLWLGGGNAKSASARICCFTIPKVRVGQKITIVAESHKPSDARGVSLFAGDCTNDELLIGESFTPKTLETKTWEEGWTLPEGATPNEDGTIDIQVYNTNGCHLYSIEVGSNDQRSKVAFIYNGDAAMIIAALSAMPAAQQYDIKAVEANGAFTLESLAEYDAIALSPTLADAEAIASLKDIRPFVPVLNLNPAIYEAWGVGTTVDSGTNFAAVKAPNHSLFRDVELIPNEDTGDMILPFTAPSFTAVNLSGVFADDQVLATVMETEIPAIHIHNANHNAYLYLPSFMDFKLIENGLKVVAASKAEVTAAPKPTISQEFKNGETVVTLKSGTPGAEIFYTIDGSEPTENSTAYTEPFSVTATGAVVKAVARGDGYLLSDVAEQAIEVKTQAAAPTISVSAEEGKTTVTITSSQAGATIYYNYSGENDEAKSGKYTEPIVLTRTRTVYAFVVAEGFINSEVASQEVTVAGAKLRTNILSHMDANSAEYNSGSTSTAYYFSWGKNKSGENGHPYYNLDSRTEQSGGIDPDTGDEVFNVVYTELNTEEENDFGTGWAVRSRGQIVDWENLTTGTSYGNSEGYNFATVEDNNPDFPATKGLINLADKNTEPADAKFPYNAYIVSTQKFAGPFDVVLNVGSIVKPGSSANHRVSVQVATDGNAWDSNWKELGDTIKLDDLHRLTSNVTRSYNGGDEAYVRVILFDGNSKVGFYDIYIANDPNEDADGIADVQHSQHAVREAVYSLSGVRQNAAKRGLNIIVGSDGTTRKVMVK